MAETMAKIPQRIHVPRDTVDATQMPPAGLAATICRTAISRNTTECASATIARLRLVRMENPPMLNTSQMSGYKAVTWVTPAVSAGHNETERVSMIGHQPQFLPMTDS